MASKRMTVPKELEGPVGEENQPVSHVVWIERSRLVANDYNPNKVAPPELRLLKISILEDGWTQPIVVRDLEDGTYEVVDGFHRTLVSEDKQLAKMTGGMVPCVVLPPKPREDRMMSTIRHNRARGEHHVLKMADIAIEMDQNGVPHDRIRDLLQMEDEELARLLQRGNMVERAGNDEGEYGKGWKPE